MTVALARIIARAARDVAAQARWGALSLIVVLAAGAMLGAVAAWPAPAAHAALAAGSAIALTALALALAKLRLAARADAQTTVYAALFDASDDACLLVDPVCGAVRWANPAARSMTDGAAPPCIDPMLADISADPSATAARLHDRAAAQGRALHTVPVAGGTMQITVQPAHDGLALWRITRVPDQDARDDLPLELVQIGPDGQLRYAAPALCRALGRAPRHLADVLPGPLPAPGQLAACTTRLPDAAPRSVLRLPDGTGGDTVLLLPATLGAGAAEDEFDALQHLPIAMGLVDAAGRLTRSNDEACRLLHLSPDAAPRLDTVLEGLGRPVGEWLADIRDGRVTAASEVLRATNTHEDRFLQVTLRRMGRGDAAGVLAVLQDATEFKALEAKFTQSQRMQAIGQLAGGVAHDFNNLLTAISGHCDLILLRRDRSDVDYPDLMQIQQNTNRAAALVRQLLAFSRKQTLQFETLDLHDTLADAVHLLNRLVGEKVTLTLDHGHDVPLIRADKRQFEQVLMNLVVNARDAMPMGGEIVIATAAHDLPDGLQRDKARLPPGHYAVIQVRDDGIGMAPGTLAKVFDPFFSTKRPGEGTGLGLSTVYGIVKQSGGFVFADSTEGSGTCFSIYFAAQAADAPAPSDPQPAAAASLPAAAARCTVLLVEDEAPVRAFAARALRLQGHEVLEADSGEAALDLLTEMTARPDLIVTDVIMPGLDGPGLVKKLRPDHPDTPVIFISGYAEDGRTAAQARIGHAVFLGKPFALAEFTALVDAQLRATATAA